MQFIELLHYVTEQKHQWHTVILVYKIVEDSALFKIYAIGRGERYFNYDELKTIFSTFPTMDELGENPDTVFWETLDESPFRFGIWIKPDNRTTILDQDIINRLLHKMTEGELCSYNGGHCLRLRDTEFNDMINPLSNGWFAFDGTRHTDP
jgi:hypothetical protein